MLDLFSDLLEFLSSILELAEAATEQIGKKNFKQLTKEERSTGQHKKRRTQHGQRISFRHYGSGQNC